MPMSREYTTQLYGVLYNYIMHNVNEMHFDSLSFSSVSILTNGSTHAMLTKNVQSVIIMALNKSQQDYWRPFFDKQRFLF